eukprot:1342261-Amphidinium_carterae.1
MNAHLFADPPNTADELVLNLMDIANRTQARVDEFYICGDWNFETDDSEEPRARQQLTRLWESAGLNVSEVVTAAPTFIPYGQGTATRIDRIYAGMPSLSLHAMHATTELHPEGSPHAVGSDHKAV